MAKIDRVLSKDLQHGDVIPLYAGGKLIVNRIGGKLYLGSDEWDENDPIPWEGVRREITEA